MNDDLDHGYICVDCARERDATWPTGHCATFHISVCPYCGRKNLSLCNIGDFNWPDGKRRGMRD